jgi:hypothetical protein
MLERATFLGVMIFLPMLAFAGCSRAPISVARNDLKDFGEETIVESILQIKLEIRQDEGGVLARLVFKNPTATAVRMLKRNLLYEGEVTFRAFNVTRDGRKVRYTGLMVKRGPPTKDDWFLVEAGQSFEVTIRISDYYDLSSPGEYEVRYQAFYYPFSDNPSLPNPLLQSNAVKIAVSKRV